MKLLEQLRAAEEAEQYELCAELLKRIKAGEKEPEPTRYTHGLLGQMVDLSQYNPAAAASGCMCSSCEAYRAHTRRMDEHRSGALDLTPTDPNWRELDELRERYEKEVQDMLEKRLKKVAPRASSRTVAQSLIATVDRRELTVEYTYKGRMILKVLFTEGGPAFRIR